MLQMNRVSALVYRGLPLFAQNLVCTASGYTRFRARFTHHFDAKIAEWEGTVGWSLERLREIQRTRLDLLVNRARQHAPYYRDLPEPSKAKDPSRAIQETLASIPPLEKADYGDEPKSFIARDVPRRRLIRGQTSGTTGTSLPLWCVAETLIEEFATVWRMRRGFGVMNPIDPNLTFNGNIIVPFHQDQPPFWRRSFYDHRTLFSVYHMTPKNLRSYADAVHSLPAEYIEGYPSAIHLIARTLLEMGRPVAPGRIKAVFTSSESLLSFQRKTIERAFGAPVRDRYGVSEKVVSMTECREGSLHVDLEYCIVEVETVTETDDFETGPLLVTGLSNHATPLFRYRIGDVGTRSKHPCPCGRAGDVFLHVDGRIDDYVLTPDGRLVGRLDHIFKAQFDVAEAQIIQISEASIDVLIVPRSSYSNASSRALMREIRARLGTEMKIKIKIRDSIPREANGKFRAVKSEFGRIHV
jgi:phenylacetate-CoA ligase